MMKGKARFKVVKKKMYRWEWQFLSHRALAQNLKSTVFLLKIYLWFCPACECSQHDGAVSPCMVRKKPQVPNTARQAASLTGDISRGKRSSMPQPKTATPWIVAQPDSSVHGILQARILEWVAIPFSRWSPWPRDQTPVCCTVDRFFTVWATREAPGAQKHR